jgi:hypothetical protein
MANRFTEIDAKNKRKHRELTLQKRVLFDSSDSSFLPTMTYYALKKNAPSNMLVQLCRYVMMCKSR